MFCRLIPMLTQGEDWATPTDRIAVEGRLRDDLAARGIDAAIAFADAAPMGQTILSGPQVMAAAENHGYPGRN